MTVVKEKKLCFNCLGRHQVSKCGSTKRCTHCQRKHHSSICPRLQTTNTTTAQSETTILLTNTSRDQPNVLLKTATAPVCSTTACSYGNILFDEGAQRSFITEKLANELNLQITGNDVIHLAAFGGARQNIRHLDTAQVFIQAENGERIPIQVLIVPTIAAPIENYVNNAVTSLPYLRNLKLAHSVTAGDVFEISLLVGADHYWDIVHNQVIRGNGPTAVRSKLGFLLLGPLHKGQPNTQERSNHVLNVLTSMPCTAELERFWKLESIGISSNDCSNTETEKLKAYQKEGIEYKGGKYEAKLPWKTNHDPLPTNFKITKRRTESTINRLSKDPHILKTYGEIISDQEKNGFIEKVPDAQLHDRHVHYIPHHPVHKESTTTPVRIVYDCSCRESRDKPSLNECLESTPPVLNDLTSILVRFRYNKYGVSTDIEKAFLHVGLDERDRDYTRFMWLSDPENPSSPLQTYRFKSVLFGATCSPFILSATLLKHLENNDNEWVSPVLQRDLYVDNILSSFSNEEELSCYFTDTRSLMASAGFNLRSWNSNSTLLKTLASTSNVLETDTVTKVLGMKWDTVTDELMFVDRIISNVEDATKRHVLQQTSKVYDPLGLITPVTVRAKILLQDLWKDKYEWDERLPDDLQQRWRDIAVDINTALGKRIPRFYFGEDGDTNGGPTLHIFVDASVQSYGAVAYITTRENSAFLMSKNRVAPVKTLTLPRLELMAAVVGSRLHRHLQTVIQHTRVVFWSDSQITLHWLKSCKPLPQFIKNRVNEITELTGSHEWRYCPTADNPADLLTRGLTAKQLNGNKSWLSGPEWICDESKWPLWQEPSASVLTTAAATAAATETTGASNSNKTTLEVGIHHVIDVRIYNSLKKLLRVTAYVLRFVSKCRHKPQTSSNLTVEEIQNSEMLWIQNSQQTVYATEFNSLKSNGRKSPLVKQLKLFLDDRGYIRCGGRMHNAPLNEWTKFPLLLPAKHPLTRLVIQDAHEHQLHSGANATITELRQRYWIPSARQCVKTVLRRCVVCKKVTGSAYSAPDPPPLMNYSLRFSTIHGNRRGFHRCLEHTR